MYSTLGSAGRLLTNLEDERSTLRNITVSACLLFGQCRQSTGPGLRPASNVSPYFTLGVTQFGQAKLAGRTFDRE
jgi:hypothetical protein